jgi:hypothetical protein
MPDCLTLPDSSDCENPCRAVVYCEGSVKRRDSAHGERRSTAIVRRVGEQLKADFFNFPKFPDCFYHLDHQKT